MGSHTRTQDRSGDVTPDGCRPQRACTRRRRRARETGRMRWVHRKALPSTRTRRADGGLSEGRNGTCAAKAPRARPTELISRVLLCALAMPPTSPRGPLVLLVEDHADTRQMYAEFLRGTFEILEAGTGPQALEIARARPPAVVVTDLSLPGMDGFELIARMRKDPAMRAVAVVCI